MPANVPTPSALLRRIHPPHRRRRQPHPTHLEEDHGAAVAEQVRVLGHHCAHQALVRQVRHLRVRLVRRHDEGDAARLERLCRAAGGGGWRHSCTRLLHAAAAPEPAIAWPPSQPKPHCARRPHLHQLLGVGGRDVHRLLVALHGGRAVALRPQAARARLALLAVALPRPLLLRLVGQAAAVKHHQGAHARAQQHLHAAHAVGHVTVRGLPLHQLPRAAVGAAVQQAVCVHRHCRRGQAMVSRRQGAGGTAGSQTVTGRGSWAADASCPCRRTRLPAVLGHVGARGDGAQLRQQPRDPHCAAAWPWERGAWVLVGCGRRRHRRRYLWHRRRGQSPTSNYS